MFRYGHRLSKDIDIFVPDPQYLGYVTPRLSDTAASLTEDYAEMPGSFVKLQVEEGEVDFVAAPNLIWPGSRGRSRGGQCAWRLLRRSSPRRCTTAGIGRRLEICSTWPWWSNGSQTRWRQLHHSSCDTDIGLWNRSDDLGPGSWRPSRQSPRLGIA